MLCTEAMRADGGRDEATWAAWWVDVQFSEAGNCVDEV